MIDTWPGRENHALVERVNGALQLIPDFPETCKSILDVVIEEIEAENCSLMLVAETGEYLELRAVSSPIEDEGASYPSGEWKGKRFRSGEGVSGRVAKTGKTVRLDDSRRRGYRR